jgi:hypothetical protein
MDHTICPGSKILRSPKPASIDCPSCGYAVEIWSDEIRAVCPRCKKNVVREGIASCLDWCKKGKECVGETIYNKYMENRSVSVRQQLFQELETIAGSDKQQVDRAVAVLNFAEEITKKENGEWNIVVPAGILHNVGTFTSGASGNQDSGDVSSIQAVRKILLKVGMRMEDIEVICNVVAHYRAPACGEAASQNCKIIHDAVLLTDLPKNIEGKTPEERMKIIAAAFLTPTGAEMAKKSLL